MIGFVYFTVLLNIVRLPFHFLTEREKKKTLFLFFLVCVFCHFHWLQLS